MGQAQPYAPGYEANEVGQPHHQYNMMSQQQLQHQQHPEQNRSAPQHQQQQMVHHHRGTEQKWHASYCGFCSPFDLCMKAWCCPCFVYGKTKHRMQSNGNMNGYDSMNSSVSHYSALPCSPLLVPQDFHSPTRVLMTNNIRNFSVFCSVEHYAVVLPGSHSGSTGATCVRSTTSRAMAAQTACRCAAARCVI